LSTAFRFTEQQEKTAFEIMKIAAVGTLEIGTPVFIYILKDDQGRELQLTVPSDIAAEEIEAQLKPQLAAFVPAPRKKKPKTEP
jgi:hypothetical protein